MLKLSMVLREIESAFRRRIRERYDQTRSWNRKRIDSLWNTLLFSRSVREQHMKAKTLLQVKSTVSFDQKRGFGVFTEFDDGFLGKVQTLAESRRIGATTGDVSRTNTKDYLQQIFDLSMINQENLFFLEGILKPDIIDAVSNYFDNKLPLLHEASIFFSPPRTIEAKSWEGSQLYHRDGEGTRNLKLWILCRKTSDKNGPTVLLDAESSEKIAREIDYVPGEKLPDIEIELTESYKNSEMFVATGEAGAAFYTDTCRSFHYGSRTTATSSRLVAMYHFVDNNCSYYFPYVSRTFTSRLRPLSSDVKKWVEGNALAQSVLSKRMHYSR